MPSQDLGFVDPRAAVLEVPVRGRDYTIHQSPSVLASSRAGGTTGAGACLVLPLSVPIVLFALPPCRYEAGDLRPGSRGQ